MAIDWDVRSLHIALATISKRGVKIERVLSAKIPDEVIPAHPEQMGRHIRAVLQQEGVHARSAIVAIPRDQAILKTLRVPAARPADLPGIVGIQIAKELPFAASEAVIDFVAGGRAAESAGTMDLLVAAIRRELIQLYEETIAAAGLKLERIGLRPYAHKLAVCEALKFALPERVLFIDVHPLLTEIGVLRDGSLAFSRAASVLIPEPGSVHGVSEEAAGGSPRLSLSPPPAGVSDGGDPGVALRGEGRVSAATADVIQSLLVEVNRSIEAYRVNDAGAQLDHAVIAGDTGLEEALGEAISKRLGIPSEPYNPASTFGWEPEEGAGACGFAGALGLVLGEADTSGAQFDFLHPKRVVSVAQERLRKAPIVAGVAALFVVAPVIYLERSTAASRRILGEIEKQIAESEGKQGDNKKFLDFVESVRKFDFGQHVWVDVLYDIQSVLPGNDELVLTHMEFNQEEGRVLLRTKAVNRDTATKVQRALSEFRREGRDKPRFQAVVGPQDEKKKEKYPYAQDFRVVVLNDDADKRKGDAGKGS